MQHSKRTIRNGLIPIVTTMMVSSCGGGRGSRIHEETDLVRYAMLLADEGGTVQSTDGLFEVVFEPNSYDEDVEVKVAQLREGPLFETEHAASKPYEVTINPESPLRAGDVGLRFYLDSSAYEESDYHFSNIAIGTEHGDMPPQGVFNDIFYSSLAELSEAIAVVGTRSPYLGTFVALSTGAGVCSDVEWRCNTNRCIPTAFRCDDYPDCEDGSDEDERCDGYVPPPDVLPDAYEPDSFEAPAGLMVAVPQERTIHTLGDRDYATFTVYDWSDVELTAAGDIGDLTLILYDAAQNILAFDDDAGTGRLPLLNVPHLPAGDYVVMVTEQRDDAEVPAYDLLLAVSPSMAPRLAPVSIAATAYEDRSIKVMWPAVPLAVAYQVHYDDDGVPPFDPTESFDEGESAVETAETSFTFTNALVGRRYFFAVTAVHPTGLSAFSPVVAVSVPVIPDIYEDDDAVGAARVIESEESQVHSLHHDADVDYLMLEIMDPSDVTIMPSGHEGLGVVISVFDNDGVQIVSPTGGVGVFPVVEEQLTPGRYFVRVASGMGPDVVFEYEIVVNIAVGLLPPEDVIAVSAPGSVTVSWSAAEGAASYMVYYDNDGGPTFSPSSIADQGHPIQVTETQVTLTGLPSTETVFIGVRSRRGSFMSELSSDAWAAPEGVPDAYEVDNDTTLATPIADDESQEHSLHMLSDTDFYTFTVLQESEVTISTSGTIGGTEMVLYDSDGLQLVRNEETGFSSLFEPNLRAGTYFVEVYSSGGLVDQYTISLDIIPIPVPPESVGATGGVGSITVTWDEVPAATSYRVHYDDDADNPPFSTTLVASEGASPVSTPEFDLTLTGLPPGVTMYIAVTAIFETVESDYSAQVTATVLAE